jgi:predicted component of type VI protein secretion system
MDVELDLVIMSGVEDGRVITLSASAGNGGVADGAWHVRIGRRDDNDVWMRYDSFASRYHARVHWRENRWWLEDCASKNGTYVEQDLDEARISGTIPIEPDQLFRVGRTWFRIAQGTPD